MPAGSPPQATERLNAELNSYCVQPRIRSQLENGGFNAQASTPDALAVLIKSTTDKIAEVVKTGNVMF